MRPSFSLAIQHVSQVTPAVLPLALLAACTLSGTKTPFRHSLFVESVAWLIVCVYHGARLGVRVGAYSAKKRRLSWFAGFLYALAQLCDRAAGDVEGTWWTKSLLPLAVYFVLRSVFERDGSVYISSAIFDKMKAPGTRRLLLIATGTSLIVLNSGMIRFPVNTLGLCSVVLTACALAILEHNLGNHAEEKSSPLNTPNGLINKMPSWSGGEVEVGWTTVRDMAAVVAVVCMIASLSFETFKTYKWEFRVPTGKERPIPGEDKLPEKVRVFFWEWDVGEDLFGITIECAKAALLLLVIRRQGVFEASVILLGGIILTRIVYDHSWWEVWLFLLYAFTSMLVLDDPQSTVIFSSPRKRVKARQWASAAAGVTLGCLGLSILARPAPFIRNLEWFDLPIEPSQDAHWPVKVVDPKLHPIDQLIRHAESEFNKALSKQSKSLPEAVAEYRHRYGIPPPPNFDIWYEFAKRKGVQLIDEYDTIHHTLLPFWGLSPSVIRARVSEAIGYDNVLLSVLIRGGQVAKVENGPEWQQEATLGMMKEFIQHLPDMDLAFNLHDEPRVILPADQLAKLVERATNLYMPDANAQGNPKNEFSPRPADIGDGKRIKEYKTTRFNRFAHQHTWSHSRASCSAESPARDFQETSQDNITAYSYGDLGFIYNTTAFSDICLSPSLRETFGFFDRPNAFNIVQDLFPIFSQSKISSFQDIIYPSPWYWSNKVVYDKERDVPWDKKEDKIYWRGSTTGGFSRNGGWRRQHRQGVVRKFNAPDTTTILATADGEWHTERKPRRDYQDIVDVRFSHVGQCDPGDCDAQKEYFNVTERVDQQDAWKFKYLLDMDGNAFSGRFYAFLRSNSMVYKMSIFREWHMDWMKPWVHYIPMSLRGDEWLESVRYFNQEPGGKKQAATLAIRGQQWAMKALRNEDFEVWFFRLLLEYGRLVDDNRGTIGYSGQ